MLEMRPNCEHCNRSLPQHSAEAYICSYECTFCRGCVEHALNNVCPNCGGGFSPRPIRRPEERVEAPGSVHGPGLNNINHGVVSRREIGTDDQQFLQKRHNYGRLWPLTGHLSLLLLAALGIGLWLWTPYLINPWALIADLQGNSVEPGTVMLLATFTPVFALALLFFVAVFLLQVFTSFANERRLLQIITTLSGASAESEPPPSRDVSA